MPAVYGTSPPDGCGRFEFSPATKQSLVSRSRVSDDGFMSDTDLRAELERLKAENERLKAGHAKGVSLKVSEKGGVSVYGLGRFPVTLYKEQWTRLLDMSEDIRTFIKDNDSRLKTKGE
jgi:hypothetical protein